ncbi:hypothetical protein [Caulobacter sp. FWC2]|uniref:hypothetical protein n=1 Tax=Caulobacter sp. FWC2 TaxID=69664 RepID=UPI000C15B4CD|nr:hypothetical protein [Caulobacter sp. FWC2]PIB93711.1 hypothetical protein CSW62_20310 [Caulobacter sp. FWC2]
MTDESGGGRPVAKLFGALLMAVGGLIVGLCGLCTAGFVVMTGKSDPSSAGGLLVIAAVVAGIPIVVGVLIFIGGRNLWRGPQPSQSSSSDVRS